VANLHPLMVRVRLTRVGSKKNPIWRVVVADQRSPRDGRIIESIGHYNPQTEPSTIVIDRDRLQHWLERGAEPTNTIRKLMRAKENTAEAPAAVVAEAEAAAPEAEAAAPEAEQEASPPEPERVPEPAAEPAAGGDDAPPG
jgi:small subunit ribosomal protein S16